jgi:hypothetical protein
MASWDTLSIKFDPLAPLKPPLQAVLVLLEVVEAILEALLAIIKAFLLDFLNPLKALIALLLAAIRAIINQLKATGFSILVVHPDFSRQDFAQILLSVSGSYPRFESKVVSKFFDSSDVFRPQYPPGSSVAMFVFYIGTDSPGDLITQLFALLRLINTPAVLSALPAPVSVKVNPVRKSGSPVANFAGLFDSKETLNDQLVVEWQMPTNPGGSGAFGFVNAMTSFYNSFRFPNFIVERSETPQGELVQSEVNTPTAGKSVKAITAKYKIASPETKVAVKEPNGTTYRNFKKKIKVSGADLAAGAFIGTYRYIDKDELKPGTPYYYRVRAYFGDATEYLGCGDANAIIGNTNVVPKNNGQPIIKYGSNGVVMGPVSEVRRGFVPNLPSGSFSFNPYESVNDAVKAGLLLNFDLPAPPDNSGGDTGTEQRTGWSTLAAAGGQMGPIKSAFKTSDKLYDNFLFKSTARRISNSSLTSLLAQKRLLKSLAQQWNDGVEATVNKVLGAKGEKVSKDGARTPSDRTGAEFTWTLLGIVGGITDESEKKIQSYLLEEKDYKNGQSKLAGPYPLGPFTDPKGNEAGVTAEDRRKLGEFLRSALISLSGETSYLAWYSVTVGDLFPAFIPFIYDIEQFILALLKALQSALQAIEDIILTIIRKIQALEQIVESIIALIDLLNISVRVAVFATASTNGSAESLAQALQESENKPASSPFGLHSGLVMTFGGPGEGFIAAFKALAFILTLPF